MLFILTTMKAKNITFLGIYAFTFSGKAVFLWKAIKKDDGFYPTILDT